jgi:hypothetical protein
MTQVSHYRGLPVSEGLATGQLYRTDPPAPPGDSETPPALRVAFACESVHRMNEQTHMIMGAGGGGARRGLRAGGLTGPGAGQ